MASRSGARPARIFCIAEPREIPVAFLWFGAFLDHKPLPQCSRTTRFRQSWLTFFSAMGVRQIGLPLDFLQPLSPAVVLRFGSSRPGSAMKKRHPLKQAFGMSLLLLSGCDVARNARDDLSRATGAIASATQSRPATAQTASSNAEPRSASRSTPPPDSPKPQTVLEDPPRDDAAATPVNLIGKSESEIRVLLGPPTSEEDRAPGKTWHYRDGQCTLDIQLYPDVQTRKFGTLAYEVKSNDSTDEGKRLCMAQLKSRTQTRGG